MNAFENTIVNEYKRLREREEVLAEKRAFLPAGYISVKSIGGKQYHYLQFREGKKVKSKYIKQVYLGEMTEKIRQRKAIDAELAEIRRQKKALEGMIDKDSLMIMMIRLAVIRVVKDFPEIRKVVLFGSRAESRYREDSDVDLMFESYGPVSFMRQNEFRLRMEEELGLDVDLVHGPAEDSLLEIRKEIDLYAA